MGGIIVALAAWFAYLRDRTTANRTSLPGAMGASSQSSNEVALAPESQGRDFRFGSDSTKLSVSITSPLSGG